MLNGSICLSVMVRMPAPAETRILFARVMVELAQIGQRDRFVDSLDQIPPCVTHI